MTKTISRMRGGASQPRYMLYRRAYRIRTLSRSDSSIAHLPCHPGPSAGRASKLIREPGAEKGGTGQFGGLFEFQAGGWMVGQQWRAGSGSANGVPGEARGLGSREKNNAARSSQFAPDRALEPMAITGALRCKHMHHP